MVERKIQLLRAPPAGVAPPPAVRPPETPVPPPRHRSSTSGGGEGAAALWREVLAHLDDDAVHQAFIRASLAEGRLRFALDSYRTLEKLRPGDPVASRYITQVGKAMEVGALGTSNERQRELHARLLARPLRILVTLVMALGGMMIIYMLVQVAQAALKAR